LAHRNARTRRADSTRGAQRIRSRSVTIESRRRREVARAIGFAAFGFPNVRTAEDDDVYVFGPHVG
jgi:hypothetical protein